MSSNKLTDLTAKDLENQLQGKSIAIFFKADLHSASSALMKSFPIIALKTFFPKIRAVLQKYPNSKYYTIIGGEGNEATYKLVFDQITTFCKTKKLGKFPRYDFATYATIVNATASLGRNYFANDIQRQMEAMAAAPLHSAIVGEVYEKFGEDEAGAWVRELVARGMAVAVSTRRFKKVLAQRYYIEKINGDFDRDVRRILKESKAKKEATNAA